MVVSLEEIKEWKRLPVTELFFQHIEQLKKEADERTHDLLDTNRLDEAAQMNAVIPFLDELRKNVTARMEEEANEIKNNTEG